MILESGYWFNEIFYFFILMLLEYMVVYNCISFGY